MPQRSFRKVALTTTLLASLASPLLADEPAPAVQEQPVPLQAVEPATEKPAPAEPGQTEEKKELSEQELRQRMTELESELRKIREEFQRKAVEDRNKVEVQERKLVEDIKLPANPTRQQCEQYLAELREAAKNKRSFSSADPIVGKLRELPDEHYDLLMTEMNERSTLRYFANYALRDVDPKVMYERFVSTLRENENNIGVIVMNGWTNDVRDVIIEKIQSADASLTPAWFQAAVEIAEPDLYPKLHQITIDSRYATQYLGMLQALPDYDLANTVNACWQRAGEGNIQISQASFAPMAAEMGNIDALGALVAQLNTTVSFSISSSTYNIRRINVLRFIEYRGSNQEIQEWYQQNKDKLVFDHLRKRFVLPEDN